LALLLRFVPYIGAIIAALFPAALALATDPGWTMLLWTAVLFLVAEPITSQVIEPILYGRSTGLSPVAVVLAAAFWTWLWGPIGLLLSTPLTLCLVVLGRHVEPLQFLAIAFGDRPALAPEESLYQRMLANDPDEAAFQAEAFLKSKPLAAYYDEVAVKALALAQADVNRGLLDYEHRTQIKAVVDDIIDDLAEHDDPDTTETAPPAEDAPAWGDGVVLCIAGRGALDEAAAAMLAQLLARGGIAAEVIPSSAVAPRHIAQFDLARARLICLSYLEPEGFTNARFLIRRLRRRTEIPLLVGFWTLEAAEARQLDAREQSGADEVVTSLGAAVETIRRAVRAGAPAAA
ncbi:MAG TPA: AI-2E family transporter, partial [Candidatus Sulfotelmatobacter sp.]|nr:AI-2E family transporter [Candidatus Sulfotelmatobacter sp.]